MKNFEVTDKETGKRYWISRSIAVCAMVIVIDNDDKRYILVNQRGSGTPNFQHCWNIPCGYLDWDETTQEACTREVLEECGVYIEPLKWHHIYTDSSTLSYNQNVTLRYVAYLNETEYEEGVKRGKDLNNHDGEENEVENIELMPLSQENIYNKEWAFNHEKIIIDLIN